MTATPPTGSALATSIIELVADTLAGRIQTVRKSRSADEPGLATARRLFVALVLPVDAFRTHARIRCVAENLAVKYPDTREVAMSYARGEFSRDFTRHHEQLLAAWEADRMQIVEWLAGGSTMSGRPIQDPPQGTVPPRGCVGGKSGDVWTITVQAVGDGPPTVCRIRSFAKYLWRTHRLKALAIIEQTEDRPSTATPNATNSIPSSSPPPANPSPPNGRDA